MPFFTFHIFCTTNPWGINDYLLPTSCSCNVIYLCFIDMIRIHIYLFWTLIFVIPFCFNVIVLFFFLISCFLFFLSFFWDGVQWGRSSYNLQWGRSSHNYRNKFIIPLRRTIMSICCRFLAKICQGLKMHYSWDKALFEMTRTSTSVLQIIAADPCQIILLVGHATMFAAHESMCKVK